MQGTQVNAIYGRIWPILFPGDPLINDYYFRTNPLSLDGLGLKCSDEAGNKLPFKVTNNSGSYIEIQINFTKGAESLPEYISDGQEKSIKYQFELEWTQWGPYIERRLVRPTDMFSVELDFPKNLIDLSGQILTSTEHSPLFPSIEQVQHPTRSKWRWSLANPEWEHRYQILWSFRDSRYRELYRSIVNDYASYCSKSDRFSIDKNARIVIFNGNRYQVSNTQLAAIEFMSSERLRGKKHLHQNEILNNIATGSSRLVDIMKSNPLWKNLVMPSGKGYYFLNVGDEHEL